MAIGLLLFMLLSSDGPPSRCPASAASFSGARFDAPFFVFDGGSAGAGFGQFNAPSAIAEIGGGMVAISDAGNHRVKVVTLDGFFQDFWGQEGQGPGEFLAPGAIAAVGDGSVWVVDSGNHRLQRLRAIQPLVAELTGTHLKTLGSRGSGKGQFENPTGIALDRRGRILVVDSGNQRIQVFSARGRLVEVWSNEAWLEPYGIAADPRSDTFFITDRARHQIFQLDARGRELTVWGREGPADGQLEAPHGITQHAGYLYVADTGNARIVKFSMQGEFVAAVGCQGSEVGAFANPVSVLVDAEHHLYVVDRDNHRVQKLSHQ